MKKLTKKDTQDHVFGFFMETPLFGGTYSVVFGNKNIAQLFFRDMGVYNQVNGFVNNDKRILYVEDINNIPIITHEAVHVAVNELSSHGVPYDDGNDEVLAYLVGFYVRYITEKRVVYKYDPKDNAFGRTPYERTL